MAERVSRNCFFVLRKELRCVSCKFWTLSLELRQLQRRLNILDAKGQGLGLSQVDVRAYRDVQVLQWALEERLKALAVTLKAYGEQLVVLLADIGKDTTPEERMALLGGRPQAVSSTAWAGSCLEQLALRHRVESASEASISGPIATALMAHRGQLAVPVARGRSTARRATAFQVARSRPVRLRVVDRETF